MKTSFKLFAFFALFGFSFAATAQEDKKPAAQGYFKDQPSNRNQDRQLKELERQELQDQPKPAPTPAPAPKPNPTPQPSKGTATEA